MTFVTDEIVRVAAEAIDPEAFREWWTCAPRGLENASVGVLKVERQRRQNAAMKKARDALRVAAPLWLAHVRDASEHLADYATAAKAAVKLKEIAP